MFLYQITKRKEINIKWWQLQGQVPQKLVYNLNRRLKCKGKAGRCKLGEKMGLYQIKNKLTSMVAAAGAGAKKLVYTRTEENTAV